MNASKTKVVRSFGKADRFGKPKVYLMGYLDLRLINFIRFPASFSLNLSHLVGDLLTVFSGKESGRLKKHIFHLRLTARSLEMVGPGPPPLALVEISTTRARKTGWSWVRGHMT